MKNGYLDMWEVTVQKPANLDLYLKDKYKSIVYLLCIVIKKKQKPFMFTNLYPEIIYMGKGQGNTYFSKIKYTGYLGTNDMLSMSVSGGAFPCPSPQPW